MKSKLIVGLILITFLLISSCGEDDLMKFQQPFDAEEWKLVKSNCKAHQKYDSAVIYFWEHDVYKFELSPFGVYTLGAGDYVEINYHCDNDNRAIWSSQRYSGFHIRASGNTNHRPPEIIYAESTLTLRRSSDTFNVITEPYIFWSIPDKPIEKPWYTYGTSQATAALFFQKIPDNIRIIYLEIPYIDKPYMEGNEKNIFTFTFSRVFFATDKG